MVTQMISMIGLIVYSYFAIPWMMDTIGTSVIASLLASIVTYFVGIGMIFGWRPWYQAPQTNYYDYDRWDD